jgi:hypothetical protein
MVKMKSLKLFAFALIAAISILAATTFSFAADCIVNVVTESEISRQAENTPPLKNWVLYTRNAGNGAFRSGPAIPPLGVGSIELVTPTGIDKVTLFNFDHIGTALADIDKLGYSTYRTAGSASQVTALNIQVDVNGVDDPNTPVVENPGGFTTLVFEPVYNLNQGAVQDGVWQTWDAYSGGQAIWWSSNPIPGAPNRDTFVTWDTIVQANPDAVIVGGFGINQGSGNPALTAASDALTIGSNGDCITYNFDPYRVATTKEDCKNGGYNNFRDAQGNQFKNQGQCIQFVNNGK